MLIEKYSLLSYRKLTLVCSLIFLILLIVPLKPELFLVKYIQHISGICLLFILYFMGNIIMKHQYFCSLFSEVSKISYCVFLLQHLIIFHILDYYSPEEPFKVIILLGITIIYTLAMAKVLLIITNFMLNCRMYIAIEKKLHLRKN